MEIKTKARKWGNSLAIILPDSVVKNTHIRENEDIIIDIKKRHLAQEFFGILPGWKKSTQQLKDEMRKGW